MDPREELAALRRLAELEAKAGGVSTQQAPAEKPDTRSWQQRGLQNLAMGAIRGAGNIGSTLLGPLDKIGDWASQGGGSKFLGIPDRRGQQVPSTFDARRTGMDESARALGADTDSAAFGVGKLGAEIAGTAGVGGGLARAAGAVPAIAQRAAPVIDAIGTAGFRAGGATGLGGMAARTVGGGITGTAAAGLVNPDDAATGGMVGAALPGGIKAAGTAGKAIGGGVNGILKHVLGLSTGVGAEPISQAFKAGRTANQEFLANMRGDVPIHDVLDRAKQGISAMVAEKSAQYRSGMIPIAGDKSVLSLASIDKALADAASVSSYKGQVKNESAAGAVAKMRQIVDEWRHLDPAQFHTPEGLDALKQKLGGVMESIPFQERTARLAAGKVYTAAKSTIEQQAPTYHKVMRDYAAAAEEISEIERALSLGQSASKDTAMRKLQSLMRNNVQTNYGNRLSLANTLEQGGGVELMPALAGQAMSSMTPRSLAGQIGGGATTLGAILSGNLPLLAALPFQSPRAVGSMAYGAGRMSGLVSGVAQQAQQSLLGGGAQGLLGAPSPFGQLLYQSAPVLAVGQ